MSTKREILQELLEAVQAQRDSNLDVIAKVQFEMTREAAWLDEEVTDTLVFTASVLHPEPEWVSGVSAPPPDHPHPGNAGEPEQTQEGATADSAPVSGEAIGGAEVA